jgi:nucleotide-binding universal stress UspA family protein
MSRLERIVHPSDFSGASAAAFAQALALARGSDAELVIVHVFTPPVPTLIDGNVPPNAYIQIAESARRWARRQLERLVAKAERAGVRARGRLLEGIAHERIARAAPSKRTDLIVMGTHGRTGLARLVLGSVAERVISIARCPVLTVRSR